MSTAKYTPGPWEAGWWCRVPTVFDSRGNGTVALATVHDMTTGDPEANARLIAAAPDLLAACEKMVAYRDRSGPLSFQLEKADYFFEMARQAIARADREEQPA